MMALMAWRSVLGGLNAFNTNSGTMMLGFPEWIAYAAMVPPMALTAIIALMQAILGVTHTPEDHAHEVGAGVTDTGACS